MAEQVFIPFTVGGGIRTVDDFKKILREGADKVSVNSAAIDNPELIREAALKFGSQCVVVAIDAKRRADGSGWNIYKRSENEKIPHERKCLTTRKDGRLIIKVGKDNNGTFMNVTTG